jgi:hypothetical protein
VTGRKKILLGQLGRRGDCLFATTVARQIKHDYPDSHLTWAISTMCRSVIEGNPHVDQIWEISQNPNENPIEVWNQFLAEVAIRENSGEFDEIFLTQVPPGNFHNYDGTSRSSLFRGYPRPITVPIEPVVRLSETEVTNVKNFIELNSISSNDKVILFECASTSGQSFVTPEFALATARIVGKSLPDIKFILASNLRLDNKTQNVIDGSTLSFMENAELTKYCTLLLGCSSGISWLATSDWANPLPKIQLLSKSTHMYASMMHDAKYFGLPTEQIMEMQDCTPELLGECIVMCLRKSFAAAKSKYHLDIPINYYFYFMQLYGELLAKDNFAAAVKAIISAIDRYRYNFTSVEELYVIINTMLMPYLSFNYNKIKNDEIYEITDILSKNRIGNKIHKSKFISFISLFIKSLIGNNSAIARILLRDILANRIWKEMVN